MNVFIQMIIVTVCYTATSLSDKYTISSAGLSHNEFTFIMCSSMSFFLAISLPFQEIYFTFSWQSLTAILLMSLCKIGEFQMSALVLKYLSAFELKAWLGISLFISYFTDVIFGTALHISKLAFLLLTALGLVLIVYSSEKDKVNYKKLALPLILYILSKYGYGLIVKSFSAYISPIMQLLPAMILISVVLLLKVSTKEMIKKNSKDVLIMILMRIPNTLGMLLENMVIKISLTDYSLIQPMILIVLFLISLIYRENHSRQNLLGSIFCATGIVIFQLM